MSETARDPTNSWVPTCDRRRLHNSTTNTVMLPTDPMKKMIHWTTTMTYVVQWTSDVVVHPVWDIDVVPVELQTFVSSEPFSFANDEQPVTFMLTLSPSPLFLFYRSMRLTSFNSKMSILYFVVNDAYSWVSSHLFLLVALCCHSLRCCCRWQHWSTWIRRQTIISCFRSVITRVL